MHGQQNIKKTLYMFRTNNCSSSGGLHKQLIVLLRKSNHLFGLSHRRVARCRVQRMYSNSVLLPRNETVKFNNIFKVILLYKGLSKGPLHLKHVAYLLRS